DLASQPTLSRFENAVTIADLWQLRDEFAERFIQSFNEPPLRITLDLDAFDDPAHGRQQLIMFHGYYDQYQYLPIITTYRSFPARQPRRARRASRTERLNRAVYRAIQNPTSPRISSWGKGAVRSPPHLLGQARPTPPAAAECGGSLNNPG